MADKSMQDAVGKMVRVIPTKLKDCYELVPKRLYDDRGYFTSVTKEQLRALGFKEINQVSNSFSSKGVFRGLHTQANPYCQAKVVRCHQGAVLDIVTDLRKGSPTYGQYVAVKLTPPSKESLEKHIDDGSGNMLYVPRGFGHGFLALEDNTLFEYYVDNKYAPKFEDGVSYVDPDIKIDWDSIKKEFNIDDLILKPVDENRYNLKDLKAEYTYKPKKFLVTGYKGQLGYDIVRELHARGEEDILALDIDQMDLTDENRVNEIVEAYKPDVIFHCAAYTAVDAAEDETEEEGKISNKEKCERANVLGTKNITDASIKVGAKIIYMSTDYVFDGTKDLSEKYTETDEVNPMSVYGRTKYEGEQEVRRNPNHFITRISWVFGINGNNFINAILKKSFERDTVPVVADQYGSPTYTVDLARLLVEMSYTDKYGTYNVNNEGYCNWADFARYFLAQCDRPTIVDPVTTEEWQRIVGVKQAYRPRNSQLSKDKLEAAGFNRLPSWENAVDRYIEELKSTNKMLLLEHPVPKK